MDDCELVFTTYIFFTQVPPGINTYIPSVNGYPHVCSLQTLECKYRQLFSNVRDSRILVLPNWEVKEAQAKRNIVDPEAEVREG
jgi:hypothetical protein